MSKKCTPLWRKAHFQVKMNKAHHVRTIFGSWDVEKMHAVVARSTFGSQNVKKHKGFGPLLEVQISKKCTPLWREAHFWSQNVKNTSSVLVTLYNDQVEPLYNARLGPHYIETYRRFSPCILKRLPRWNQEKHSIGMLRFVLACVDGSVPHTHGECIL